MLLKNPNGYGTVTKLSGNRRKPWIVKEGKSGKQKPIGYTATKEEGLILLAQYNNDPWDIKTDKITLEELYTLWLEKRAVKLGASNRSSLKSAYKHCSKLAKTNYKQIKSYQMQDCIDGCGKGYSTQGAIKNLWGHLDRFAMELDIIMKCNSNLLTSEPIPETTKEVFTDKEVSRLWENQNLPSKIDDKISTHNADTSAHPDKLPLSGGQMTGELKLGASSGARLNNKDGYGVIFRKDASNFYILVTAQNDEDGVYTAQRPLKIDLATGVCSINGAATTDSLGNVISTTYAPLSHPAFSNGVEILGTTPYIDFHYNNSESDYTFRIVQNSEDTLTLGGKVAVSGSL